MYFLEAARALSRREIATLLGLNPNTVCRMLWEAGLPPAEKKVKAGHASRLPKPSNKPRRPPKPRKRSISKARLPLAFEAILPLHCGILDLRVESCRWVTRVGDQEAMAAFCGKPKAAGSYCKAHAQKAYA